MEIIKNTGQVAAMLIIVLSTLTLLVYLSWVVFNLVIVAAMVKEDDSLRWTPQSQLEVKDGHGLPFRVEHQRDLLR